MADGKKTYSLVVNGITETIDAVKSLNQQLDTLEQKITALSQKTVNVSTGGGSTTKTSELSQQDKLEKQILQNEEKMATMRTEEYKALLMQKETIKEINTEMKANVASENLVGKQYENTMQGLKAQLRDLKAAMQTEDIGSEAFKKMSQEAGVLTQKLKDIEASYGTFSRNVGNYKSAFDDVKKITVTIAGSTREFDNLRQASAELKKELQGLEFNGKGNTKMADDLRKSIQRLESAMSDAKAATYGLDKAMDMMQSFTSMASIGSGVKAFFGVDNSEIQKSIQKLVALQNVMKGIQTLQKQITTKEGMGMIFSAIGNSVDKATHKLLVYNRAILGTGTAAKIAASGIKFLGATLKAIPVLAAISLVSSLVNKIGEWVSGSKKAEEENKRLEASFKQLNSELEERNKQLEYAEKSGYITSEEKFEQTIRNQCELIQREIDLLLTRKRISESGLEDTGGLITGSTNLGNTYTGSEWGGDFNGITVNGVDDMANEYKKLTQAINEANKEGSDYVTIIDSAGTESWKTVDSINKLREEMEKKTFVHFSTTISNLQKSLDNGEISAEEFRRKLVQIKKQMQGNEAWRGAIANLPAIFGDSASKAEEVVRAIKDVWGALDGENANTRARLLGYLQQLDEFFMSDLDKSLKPFKDMQNELTQGLRNGSITMTEYVRGMAKSTSAMAKIQKDYRDKEDERNKAHFSKTLSEADRRNKELIEQEETLQQLELRLMADGLDKKLRQFDEEKRRTLNKLKNNEQAYLEAEKMFDRLRLKVVEDFNKEMEDKKYQLRIKIDKDAINEEVEAFNQALDILSKRANRKSGLFTEDDVEKAKEISRQMTDIWNEMVEKEYPEEAQKLRKTSDEVYEILLSSYGLGDNQKNLKDSLQQRFNDDEAYYHSILERMKTYLDERKKLQEKAINDEIVALTKAENERYDALSEEERDEQAHVDILNNINLKHLNDLRKLRISAFEEQSKQMERHFDDIISDIRDFNGKINEELSKQPVYDSEGWGIINLGKTKKNFNEIKAAAEEMFKQITVKKIWLSNAFNDGLISEQGYNAALTQLNDLETDAKNSLEKIKNDIEELGGEWWKSINEWIQTAGQALSNIMSSLSEITSNGYDEQIDAQEEFAKKYEELAKKQEQIAQQHADRVNDIEDELANARGDRRQHLIDSLNAEIEAQREAVKAQEAAEKRKEDAEHKAAWLEYDQAMARKHMDEAQAALNAAMAISMAAVNHWPIPAIPMMALATAVGAAQYAAVKSQYIPKPKFEKGGILAGPSHKNGGIPVGNTGIEVEGKEYVIRKKSTEKNIPVLDFINKAERKLTLDDFIDFYSTAPKRTLKSIRNKYADGGILPSPNIDISDLQDRTLVVRDDTPVVVEVKEILDKANSIRKVEALAGLVNKNNL